MKPWFQMKVEDDVAEVQIMDFIGDWIDDLFGFGLTAKQFADALAKLPENTKTIRLRINSPGGDVFGAVTIANALRAQKEKGRRVETVVDGLAASAASVVAMAGDTVKMADNALLMIHNPWSGAVGAAADLRKQADVLDEVRDRIVVTYQWHAELSDKEIKDLMDAETWMSADQAIELGFADEKIAGLSASASIDPRSVRLLGLKIPAQYVDQVKAWQRGEQSASEPASAPVVDDVAKLAAVTPTFEAKILPAATPLVAQAVVALCAEAGLDLPFANGIIESGLTEDAARVKVAEEKGRRDAEAKRQGTITALCGKFKQGDLAPELIAGGMAAEQARSLVAKVTALVDRVEVDAGLNPDVPAGGSKRQASLNPGDIYRERNSARK